MTSHSYTTTVVSADGSFAAEVVSVPWHLAGVPRQFAGEVVDDPLAVLAGELDVARAAPVATEHLKDMHVESFRAFWPFKPWFAGKVSPRGTPHWDALARVPLRDGRSGVVMVEAKAHRTEFVKPDDHSKADAKSLDKIRSSFAAVRDFYEVSDIAPAWESSYYQFCNRLAHLWWMNEQAKVPTWLVWVMIVDDPVWPDPMSAPQWHEAFQAIKRAVGLPGVHGLRDQISVVYLPPAPDEEANLSSS